MKLKLFVERGQALILIALAAIGLFGATGLVIDGGAKFSDRRHAQNAADTAVLAGALARVTAQTQAETDPITWTPQVIKDAMVTAAKNRATENGYDGNLVSNQVWVYSCDDIDPTSPVDCGPTYNGNSDYIQVAIRSYVNTYFARVIGINRTKNVVSAVVLTKKGGPLFDGASFVSLDPHPTCGNGSFNVGGNGNISLNGGGMFVNSSQSCGYKQTSCSVILTINSGGISSAGGGTDNIDQSCGIAAPEDTTKSQVVIPDEVYMPKEPAECSQVATAYQVGSKWHITPGYYAPFPQTSLNGDIVGIKQDLVMDPGVYCVGQNIHWSGTTFNSLDGSSGVTIYLKPGVDFNFNINSPITLAAPHTGSVYDGYIIIQEGSPSSIGSCTINGGSYLTLTGTIFAPYCNITINGDNNSNSIYNTQVIGWDLKLNGGSTIDFTYHPSDNAKSKRKVGLMR
jgi:putative Flp pilus-assembly TadE/G-like protein